MTILRITMHKRIGVVEEGANEEELKEIGFYD